MTRRLIVFLTSGTALFGILTGPKNRATCERPSLPVCGSPIDHDAPRAADSVTLAQNGIAGDVRAEMTRTHADVVQPPPTPVSQSSAVHAEHLASVASG